MSDPTKWATSEETATLSEIRPVNATARQVASEDLDGFRLFDLVLVICSCLLNILTLVVVLRPRLRRTSFGVHLAWLSVADATYLLTHAVFFIESSLRSVCQTLMYLAMVTAQLSSWSLVLLAAERAVAVNLPHHARLLATPKRAFIMQVVLLLLLLVINIGAPFNSDVSMIDGNNPLCLMLSKELPYLPSLIYKVLLYSFLPFCFMVVFNSLLVIGMRRSMDFRRGKSGPVNGNGSGGKSATNVHRISVMLLATCLVFVITTLPLGVVWTYVTARCQLEPEVCRRLTEDTKTPFDFLFRLKDINHGINFFVYFLFGSTFRKEVLEMCGLEKIFGKETVKTPKASSPSTEKTPI